MKQINLVTANNESFKVYSRWDGGNISLTPVYFEDNGKRHFIANTGDRDTDINWYAEQLANNDGKYFCFYCFKNNLFEFLDMVDESKSTYQDAKFDVCGDWVDFHGNLRERSCAFMYRIYDMTLFDQLRKRLPKIKVRDLEA